MRNSYKKQFALFCFLCIFPVFTYAQNSTVSGEVKDEHGEALIGVSIVVQGTGQGTVSDIDGQYRIEAAANGKLSFSYIGYQTQVVEINGRKTISVTLREDSKTLDELVVIGYGSMKKSDLTGAITSVSTDAIAKSVPTSIDQVLQGRAAGVQVQQNSGAPGASTSIRIRGINSLNASTEPIFVIDGVIIDKGSNSDVNSNPLSFINPADIVSMDILKDASATAIYGAQGSNGVIIVNTRRGQKGDATINYNGYIGWQQLPKHLDVLNLQQYARHRNTLAENGLIPRSNAFVRPDLLGEGTDWQSELFNTALMHNHNLSVSGGNEKTIYNLSAGYSNQDGIAVGSDFKRMSLSGNFDSQIKSWAKAGVNFAFSNTAQKLTVSDQSLVLNALRYTPDVPVRNADGSLTSSEDNDWLPANPIAMATLIDNHNTNTGGRANTFLELAPQFIKGLTYRTEFTFDLNIYQSYRFKPTYYLSKIHNNSTNEKTDTKQFNQYYSWRNILTYDRTFGVNKITAMLGHEMSKSSWDYLSGYRPDFTSNGATDLTLGDPTRATNDGYTGASSLLSYFGRVFYSFDEKYMLTATMRRDGSSKFAPQNRWGWFPSFAAAWRVSQENFLAENDIINNLKLRGGWGKVGNQNIPTNTAWLAIYNTVPSEWGYSGLIPGNTPNEDLVWESTGSGNIGVDLSLFNNRIDLAVDLYYKKTDNLLMLSSLPGYTGTGVPIDYFTGHSERPWVNLGSLENKGFEFTLNTQNIVAKNFNWNSNFTFSLNRNKILSLNTTTGEDVRSISDNTWGGGGGTVVVRNIVGQPIGQFYGYQVIGRFEKATDFYTYDKDGNVVRTPVMNDLPIDEKAGVWIGDYMYRDKNGDGKIDGADRDFIGNPEPKFIYGIANTFSYKDFDLTIQLTGAYGNDVVNYTQRYMGNPYRNTSNFFTSALDYAKVGLIDANGPNDYRNVRITGGNSHLPRMPLSTATSDYDYAFSDRFVEDGSYLRIQNVSIGYNLPKALLKKMEISNVKLYVNLQNLYTFTKYKGYDPEIGTMTSAGNQLNGIDSGRYPSPRIYTVGLNVTF